LAETVTKIGQLFRELCKKTHGDVSLLNAVFAVKITDWLMFIKYRKGLIISSSQGTIDHSGATTIRQGRQLYPEGTAGRRK